MLDPNSDFERPRVTRRGVVVWLFISAAAIAAFFVLWGGWAWAFA